MASHDAQPAVTPPRAGLSCAILLSDAPREREALETAFLAHVLHDETVDDDYTGATLSADAAELRGLLHEEHAFCRLCGLSVAAESWCWDSWITEYLALLGANREEADRILAGKSDEAGRILALAKRVDLVTVAELASVGRFSEIMRALGAHYRPAPRGDATGQRRLTADPFPVMRRRLAGVV